MNEKIFYTVHTSEGFSILGHWDTHEEAKDACVEYEREHGITCLPMSIHRVERVEIYNPQPEPMYVTLYFQTFATTPEEAAQLAIKAVIDGNSDAYVEVQDEHSNWLMDKNIDQVQSTEYE